MGSRPWGTVWRQGLHAGAGRKQPARCQEECRECWKISAISTEMPGSKQPDAHHQTDSHKDDLVEKSTKGIGHWIAKPLLSYHTQPLLLSFWLFPLAKVTLGVFAFGCYLGRNTGMGQALGGAPLASHPGGLRLQQAGTGHAFFIADHRQWTHCPWNVPTSFMNPLILSASKASWIPGSWEHAGEV